MKHKNQRWSKRRMGMGLAACLGAGVLAATPVLGQDATGEGGDVNPALQFEAFGINRGTGEMAKFNLATGVTEQVGVVRDSQGSAMSGIEAGAYVPGFANIFGFQFDASANASRLVFIDVLDATGTVVGQEIEGGMVAGAVAAPDIAGVWRVFAVQQEKTTPPVPINGLVNINPNNSTDNEFSLDVDGNGSWEHTRDDLHAATNLPADGTLFGDYQVKRVRVKPKGNGNQNGIMLNGEPMNLKNSNTYTFVGDMTVRVFNSHVNGNGTAMGKWWIDIRGSATIEDDATVLFPNRLVQVDHLTGDVTELVRLSRAYDSLASQDGVNFHAYCDEGVFLIDAAAESETLVKSTTSDTMSAMEFAGVNLMGARAASYHLNQINLGDGAMVVSSTSMGAANLGTIVFAPTGDPSPDKIMANYD